MSEALYSFDHDFTTRTLRVELRGFWKMQTLADFQAAAAALLRSVESRGGKAGEGRILVYLRGMAVQDKSLAGGFAGLLPLYGALASKIAVVSPDSAIQRLQVRRLLTRNARVFSDEASAIEWLSVRNNVGRFGSHDANGFARRLKFKAARKVVGLGEQ